MPKYLIKHLSTSSVSLYTQCAKKWKLRYIDGVSSVTTTPLIFGTAFHKTTGGYIQSGHQGNIINRWSSVWKETVAKNADNIFWGNRNYMTELTVGKRMLNSASIRNLLNETNVLIDNKGRCQIETYFSFSIPGVDVPFIGYIDIITDDRVLGDFKTSKNKWDIDTAFTYFQPYFYLAGAKTLNLDVDLTRFNYYIFVKDGNAQKITLEGITESRIDWYLDQVRSVWRGISAESFPICTDMKWCSPKYCEYWSACGR